MREPDFNKSTPGPANKPNPSRARRSPTFQEALEDEAKKKMEEIRGASEQGDQIGRIFADSAIAIFGRVFSAIPEVAQIFLPLFPDFL
jgi:hypothetical protein